MNGFDLTAAVLLTQRLLGAGLFIQSAELLSVRRCYSPGGVLAGPPVIPWLGGRLGLAGLLLLAPFAPQSLAGVAVQVLLLGSSIWLTLRSRGPVCGGSDAMFFQVQLGLLIASLGVWVPILTKLGLGWIAAQSVLSYLLAGVAKLRNRGWWNGRALQNLLASDGPYVVFAPARRLASHRLTCVALGGGVVLLELLFPAVLVLPAEGKLVLLALAFTFHLLNALVLGLNRFVWAWLATYPAILVVGG